MKPFSRTAERMQPSAIRQMTKLSAQAGHDLITFAGGMPNPLTFPLDQLAEYAASEIRDNEGRSLQYGLTAGMRTLVQWVCEHVNGKGVPAKPESVVCTTGSQQAIDLITQILIDPGDYIFVENSTYLGALIAFVKSGSQLVPVAQDNHG